ncbi:MAG TPA: hypothetical protein VFS13_17115 [Steroidobacteraceae bacterium]|nr:hypothetical protein [Steroidobacteraceae bacterium]
MKRLRPMRFLSWILPVALGVLVVLVLRPSGFRFNTDGAAASRIAMCSQDRPRRERVPAADQSLPGDRRGQSCKHCTAPFLGTPFALLDADASVVTPLAAMIAGPSRTPAPLLRAREAHGPPHA